HAPDSDATSCHTVRLVEGRPARAIQRGEGCCQTESASIHGVIIITKPARIPINDGGKIHNPAPPVRRCARAVTTIDVTMVATARPVAGLREYRPTTSGANSATAINV